MQYNYPTLLALLLPTLLSACQEFDYGYSSFEPDTADTYYTRRFANRDDVSVSITTPTPGAPYFIYFECPYDAEGHYTGATAYLQGRTPIHTRLSVPRHVDSLYVVSPMREMRVLKAGDLLISDSDLPVPSAAVPQTRVNVQDKPYLLTDIAQYNQDLALYQAGTGQMALHYYNPDYQLIPVNNPDINTQVINYVNSCFPPNNPQPNVPAEEQTKNTDLTFHGTADDDYVAVWVSLIGTGDKKVNKKDDGDPDAKVWFYIYQDQESPSAEGLLLYGIDSSSGRLTTSVPSFNGGAAISNPLLTTEGQVGYPSVFIGYVKSGCNIGFCYQGVEPGGGSQGVAKVRYTTPSFNALAQGNGHEEIPDGFIVHKEFEVNGEIRPLNIVAFENRSTTKTGGTYHSDDDFNDIILCIEADPQIRPKEEIDIDPVIEKVIATGYYLFEDRYEPGTAANDNDFNDVVIYYEKAIYNLGTEQAPQWMCDYSAELLAHACRNTNEIGIYHNGRSFRLFDNICGQKNMLLAPAYTHSESGKISFLLSSGSDVILPYLRTTVIDGEPVTYDPAFPNNGNIYTTSYATKDFPYAMEIPFVEGHPFRWMKEGICITEAYHWTKGADAPDDTPKWYVTPRNESLVVPRTEGSLY